MKRLLAFAIGLLAAMIIAARGDDLIIDARLTMLDVFVEDPEGHPVLDLTSGDFEIIESGQNKLIEHFSLEREPVALGILVDRSSSINPFRKEIDRAAAQVLEKFDARDQSFLITFAGTNSMNVPLTNRHKDVLNSLRKAESSYGTRFYDAIFDSLTYLATAEADRKALVIFTDGADHYSARSFEDVLEAARSYGYPIYLFGYVGEDSRNWTMQGRGQIEAEFGQLAGLTNGKAIFPGKGVNCSRIAADIVGAVGYAYKIGFLNGSRFGVPADLRVQLRGDRFKGFRLRFIPATEKIS